MAQLPPQVRREVALRAIQWGVARGVSGWLHDNMAGLAELGEDAVTSVVKIAVEKALLPLLPSLGEKLMEIAGPAAAKAAEVIQPAIRKELAAVLPTFAISTGIVAGVLAVLGMLVVGAYVVRKVDRNVK